MRSKRSSKRARNGGAFRNLSDFCRRVDAQKINKRVLEALILSGSMDALAPNRASLMLQLPECRARGRAARARRRSRPERHVRRDQCGGVRAAPLPTVDEWPIERKLAGERETLGHYLSGHPTDSWRGLIARIATSPIGEIDQHYKPPAPHERRGRYSDAPYTIAGQVIAIRKRGDAMAFVQVEDWSGRMEVSLFREAWIEYGPLLTRDAILVFDGGLSLDEFSGSYQLRVNSVATIESACERSARVLRVRLNGVHARFRRTPAARAIRAPRRRDRGAHQLSQRGRSGRDRARRRVARARESCVEGQPAGARRRDRGGARVRLTRVARFFSRRRSATCDRAFAFRVM